MDYFLIVSICMSKHSSGSPWDYYKRTGGDGGISLRNKDAMLKVIDFELERTPVAQRYECSI